MRFSEVFSKTGHWLEDRRCITVGTEGSAGAAVPHTVLCPLEQRQRRQAVPLPSCSAPAAPNKARTWCIHSQRAKDGQETGGWRREGSGSFAPGRSRGLRKEK